MHCPPRFTVSSLLKDHVRHSLTLHVQNYRNAGSFLTTLGRQFHELRATAEKGHEQTVANLPICRMTPSEGFVQMTKLSAWGIWSTPQSFSGHSPKVTVQSPIAQTKKKSESSPKSLSPGIKPLYIWVCIELANSTCRQYERKQSEIKKTLLKLLFLFSPFATKSI